MILFSSYPKMVDCQNEPQIQTVSQLKSTNQSGGKRAKNTNHKYLLPISCQFQSQSGADLLKEVLEIDYDTA